MRNSGIGISILLCLALLTIGCTQIGAQDPIVGGWQSSGGYAIVFNNDGTFLSGLPNQGIGERSPLPGEKGSWKRLDNNRIQLIWNNGKSEIIDHDNGQGSEGQGRHNFTQLSISVNHLQYIKK